MSYRLKNSDLKPLFWYFGGKSKKFVSVYMRGYGDIFWDRFGREKCTRGRGVDGRELELWFGWGKMKIRKV